MDKAKWTAAEEVRSACFDLGKCNDGEGLDWLRIVHRHLAALMHKLKMKVAMDEMSTGCIAMGR